MTNNEDVHSIVLQGEQDAVVPEAEPERTSYVTVWLWLDPRRERRLWLHRATRSDTASLTWRFLELWENLPV